MPDRNTPGRPTSSASRQQTRPNQRTQSGSAKFDKEHASPKTKDDLARSRNGPDGGNA